MRSAYSLQIVSNIGGKAVIQWVYGTKPRLTELRDSILGAKRKSKSELIEVKSDGVPGVDCMRPFVAHIDPTLVSTLLLTKRIDIRSLLGRSEEPKKQKKRSNKTKR